MLPRWARRLAVLQIMPVIRATRSGTHGEDANLSCRCAQIPPFRGARFIYARGRRLRSEGSVRGERLQLSGRGREWLDGPSHGGDHVRIG
jgi:hypothetical protein